MSEVIRHLPILQVIVPLFGAMLVAFTRRGTLAWLIALAVTWTLPFIAGGLLWQVLSTGEPIIYKLGNWDPPFGISYYVDSLSAYVLLLVSVLGAVIMPFARKSVASEIDSHMQSWYYTMYLLCLAGLLGIAITGDAFNAFVFLEISSLATYALIGLGKNRRALLASYQYLIMGTIGATMYVIGVGLMYLVTGSLNFVDISERLGPASADQMGPILTAFAFLAVGISLKLALFPMHIWLPNAYTYAPSFATIFLAGTATKVAVYLLIRVSFSVYGEAFSIDELPLTEVLIALSVAAMFIASVSAIFQENAKRMLAYSSVAQIGYITLGIGLANQAGLTGSLAHIVNHGIMKTALFMAMGAVFYRIGSMRLTDLAGIGRTMPLTMGAFAVAGVGLMGVPGTAGFISKWYLGLGAIDKDMWWLVFAIVASSLLAVIYIGRITEVIWFREPSALASEARDPPLSMLVPLFVLAAATIYLGFDTRLSADVAGTIAQGLLGGLK